MGGVDEMCMRVTVVIVLIVLLMGLYYAIGIEDGTGGSEQEAEKG